MSSQQAEQLVEEQAVKFEKHKDYLIEVWDKRNSKKEKKKRKRWGSKS
jgi:hypothetical protein